MFFSISSVSARIRSPRTLNGRERKRGECRVPTLRPNHHDAVSTLSVIKPPVGLGLAVSDGTALPHMKVRPAPHLSPSVPAHSQELLPCSDEAPSALASLPNTHTAEEWGRTNARAAHAAVVHSDDGLCGLEVLRHQLVVDGHLRMGEGGETRTTYSDVKTCESDEKGMARGDRKWPLNERRRPHYRVVRVSPRYPLRSWRRKSAGVARRRRELPSPTRLAPTAIRPTRKRSRR
jgi:hypothetical protein